MLSFAKLKQKSSCKHAWPHSLTAAGCLGDAEGKASLDQGPDQEEAAGAGLGDNNDVEEDELDALTRQYEAEAAAQAKQVLARTAKAKPKQLGTAEAREQALDTPIASDSIGFKMLEKMGEAAVCCNGEPCFQICIGDRPVAFRAVL